MPCYDGRDDERICNRVVYSRELPDKVAKAMIADVSAYRIESRDATRAACDMSTILERHHLLDETCLDTRVWVSNHRKQDKKRVKRETKNGTREAIKRRALEKLDLDERRVLGY